MTYLEYCKDWITSFRYGMLDFDFQKLRGDWQLVLVVSVGLFLRYF